MAEEMNPLDKQISIQEHAFGSTMKKWEVMKAFEEGAVIQCHSRVTHEGWQDVWDNKPVWNWGSFHYRVKP